MSAATRLFGALYFAVQRVRGGVNRAMVREASTMLEAPWKDQVRRASERIRAVHGDHADWDWLRSRPVVSRTELIEPARAAIRDASPSGIEVRRTSGSTGTPFRFPKDRSMTAWMDAAMWAVYGWHGVRPGLPHVRFWGAPLSGFARWKKMVVDRMLNRRRISAFGLSAAAVGRQFRSLRRLKPVYGYGYPTLMRSFVELARDAGLDGRNLDLRVIISTGEILADSVRDELTEFFGCPVVNEYGCTESGIVGFECEHGAMHAVPVAVWPEVVDEDGHQRDDLEGEVVVTDLYGATLPLLRYRLHDRGRMSAAGCPCGRELPLIEVSSGRSDSFIQTPRGQVYDAILAYTVPPEVQRFKAYQTAPDRIEAEVVRGAGFDERATPEKVKETWQEALGPGMHITVTTVPEIPLEASGKLRYFVPLADDDGQRRVQSS